MLQAQVQLSFNPEKGVTYTHLFKTEQTGKQTINGQEIPLNTTVDMLFAMDVTDKSAAEISVECTYKEFVLSMGTPMGTLTYDSKKPEKDLSEPEKLMSQVMGSLIGRTFKMVYAPNGRVKSVSGVSEIMADVLKSADSNPAVQQMAGMFLQSYNDDAMQQMFGQTYNFYPENKVKTGDSWQGDLSFAAMGMNTDTKNTYTLKSVKDGIALIDAVSVLSMKQDTGEMSGSQKGETKIDIKTGMLESSSAVQTLTGKLTVQGIDILMDMTTKSTVTWQK